MRGNLKLTSSSGGNQNVFDQTYNFVTDFGAVAGNNSANTTALNSFNTAYAALSGRTQLIIPPGDYDFSSSAVWGTSGGDRLVISAYGATLRSQLGFANSGLANDNTHHANIQTVSAGTSTVNLVTAGQTSRFSSGQYVVVACIDLQGFGYPINPGIFEFKKIASIGSGTLTFTEPLVNSYKSTYPNYNAGDGSNIYQGGPATVYGMLSPWNQEIELKGAFLPTTVDGNFYGKVRVAKYTDCSFESYGPIPTVNMLFRMQRCTTSAVNIEVDKIVDQMDVIDCSLRAVDFQSPSVRNLYVSGTSSSVRWRGTGGGGGRTNIIGLSTPEFRFGPTSYGVTTGSVTVDHCDSANATWSPGYSDAFSNYTEAGGGVLTIITANPIPWAVPGAYCVLTDGSNNFAVSFQVTDLSASGGTTSISTTLPFPVPSTINGRNSPWTIHPHPGSDVTAISCTGSTLFTDQSALPAHSPLFGWTL